MAIRKPVVVRINSPTPVITVRTLRICKRSVEWLRKVSYLREPTCKLRPWRVQRLHLDQRCRWIGSRPWSVHLLKRTLTLISTLKLKTCRCLCLQVVPFQGSNSKTIIKITIHIWMWVAMELSRKLRFSLKVVLVHLTENVYQLRDLWASSKNLLHRKWIMKRRMRISFKMSTMRVCLFQIKKMRGLDLAPREHLYHFNQSMSSTTKLDRSKRGIGYSEKASDKPFRSWRASYCRRV